MRISKILFLSACAMIHAVGLSGCSSPASSAAKNNLAQPPQPAQPPAEAPEPEPILQVIAEIDQGPGNITVTPASEIIMSLHQFYEPAMRVVKLGAGGTLTEFAQGAKLSSVLGIQADPTGVVWMLDNAMRGGGNPKLVGWHAAEDREVMTIPLAAVAPKDAFLNDLAVDRDHDAVYIADPAGGANAALIVVDLKTKKARRVLQGHESVVPDEGIELVVEGTPVLLRTPDGKTVKPRVGVNPIALDQANEWLYFGPMHGRNLYRVRTSDLRDASLKAAELAKRVEKWADRPISDGISVDNAGNIYITDVGANSIGVIEAETRQYQVLVTDARLSWPDAFSFGPDGYLYTVANQLHRSPVLSGGAPSAKPPFLVLKIKPLAGGVAGR